MGYAHSPPTARSQGCPLHVPTLANESKSETKILINIMLSILRIADMLMVTELIHGRSYPFECPKCGYKATVSGGADTGFEFSVQTTACRDCRSLFDAAVRLRVPEIRIPREHQRARFRKTQETTPTFEVAVSRLPPSGRGLKWVTFKIECPVSPLHRVNA